MNSKRRRAVMAVITTGVLLVLSGLYLSGIRHSANWLCVAGAVVAQSSVLFLFARSHPSTAASGLTEADASLSLETRQQQFDDWMQQQVTELQQQQQTLDERHRDLAHRLTRYQEFLEYPVDTAETHNDTEAASMLRLSEHDRQVHALLEAEAERVYEKIRSNGYTINGSVDLETIRTEVQELVQRVAQIYSPQSSNPLLETSFEQLARSASRICLHSLVLLERLPLDVKRYNINEMYGYLRKAVQGYGTYQQVAPWLKHLSRAGYFGRLAAGTNPVTLGAWWLATEVGRRGAQKLIENVVDRQAVAVLHDIVTVIGVEVANVYGPGFRQRDPAWVYGSELAELLHRFPVSRESLTEALREVTALPLRSEYDRIYLYRCVADHRAAGFRISDPAMLGRSERDVIAHKLEHFFSTCIHGATPKDTLAWQNDVESRLDLKLHFGEPSARTATDSQVIAAITSIHSFLTAVAGTTHETAASLIGQTELMTLLTLEQRSPLLKSLAASESQFEPPNLDPSAEVTERFLTTLAETVADTHECDPHVEELVLETASYFRRSRAEAVLMFDSACLRQLQKRSRAGVKLNYLSGEHVRSTLSCLDRSSQLLAVFGGVSLKHGADVIEQPDTVLIVVADTADQSQRLMLLSERSDQGLLWICDEKWRTGRNKGFLIDDCELTGGKWQDAASTAPDAIILSGSMTGGGFDKMFAVLLNSGDAS